MITKANMSNLIAKCNVMLLNIVIVETVLPIIYTNCSTKTLHGMAHRLKKSWIPFYWHGLTLIPAWISNYIHYKVRDEITYPFLNFSGATVEVYDG